MGILDKIISKDESLMKDADHPFRKDITAEEFDQALTELAEKFKNLRAANPMTEEEKKKRGNAILKALNSPENPY